MQQLLQTIVERLLGKLWPAIEPVLTEALKALLSRLVDNLKGGGSPPPAVTASIQRMTTALEQHVDTLVPPAS